MFGFIQLSIGLYEPMEQKLQVTYLLDK